MLPWLCVRTHSRVLASAAAAICDPRGVAVGPRAMYCIRRMAARRTLHARLNTHRHTQTDRQTDRHIHACIHATHHCNQKQMSMLHAYSQMYQTTPMKSHPGIQIHVSCTRSLHAPWVCLYTCRSPVPVGSGCMSAWDVLGRGVVHDCEEHHIRSVRGPQRGDRIARDRAVVSLGVAGHAREERCNTHTHTHTHTRTHTHTGLLAVCLAQTELWLGTCAGSPVAGETSCMCGVSTVDRHKSHVSATVRLRSQPLDHDSL